MPVGCDLLVRFRRVSAANSRTARFKEIPLRTSPSILMAISCLLILQASTGCEQKSAAIGDSNQPFSETAITSPEVNPSSDEQGSNQPKVPAKRSFRFHYAVTITELPPKSQARIWIPVAESNAHQQVKIIQTILPAAPQVTLEKTYGNKVFYFEAVANESGEIPLEVVYEVTRTEVTPETGHAFDKRNRELFLQANRLVPLAGVPAQAIDEYLSHRQDSHQALFVTSRYRINRPLVRLPYQAAFKVLKGLGAKLEMDLNRVTWHNLRRTSATLSLLGGEDLFTIMSIFGWCRVATVQRYVGFGAKQESVETHRNFSLVSNLLAGDDSLEMSDSFPKPSTAQHRFMATVHDGWKNVRIE